MYLPYDFDDYYFMKFYWLFLISKFCLCTFDLTFFINLTWGLNKECFFDPFEKNCFFICQHLILYAWMTEHVSKNWSDVRKKLTVTFSTPWIKYTPSPHSEETVKFDFHAVWKERTVRTRSFRKSFSLPEPKILLKGRKMFRSIVDPHFYKLNWNNLITINYFTRFR